jgi:hypothetical protein
MGHQHDEDHGKDGCQPEARQPKVERRGDAEKCRFADSAEVCYTQDGGDDGTDYQAEVHRDTAYEAAEETVDEQDQVQDRKGEGDVPGGAEVLGCRVASARPGHRHRQKRDADDRHDRAHHDRREEAQQLTEVRAYQEDDDTGHDHRAVDGG